MVGKDHKSAIVAIVERKTRFTLIIQLKSKKTMEIAKKFSEILNKLNPIYKKSMTYDNGIEMARHQIITKNTGMKIYFAPLFFLGDFHTSTIIKNLSTFK